MTQSLRKLETAMSSPREQSKAAFKHMRMRLDDFYSCLFCCLNHIHDREAFKDMCNVLNKELQALIEFLRLLEDAFHEELPLETEEPKGVIWLPDMIIDRSTEILKELEQKKKVVQQSMPIFTVVENKNEQIIDILKEIDVNQITPMNALNLISDLKEKIK